MEEVQFVAWWGAIVATSLLLWDIAKWFRNGPILRKRVQLNVVYPEIKVPEVEASKSDSSAEVP